MLTGSESRESESESGSVQAAARRGQWSRCSQSSRCSQCSCRMDAFNNARRSLFGSRVCWFRVQSGKKFLGKTIEPLIQIFAWRMFTPCGTATPVLLSITISTQSPYTLRLLIDRRALRNLPRTKHSPHLPARISSVGLGRGQERH